MPVILNGQTYYRTADACRIVGISRNTLFRWLKEGRITDVEHRDCRGWRLFTQNQIDTIKKKTLQINTIRLQHTNEQSTGLNQQKEDIGETKAHLGYQRGKHNEVEKK